MTEYERGRRDAIRYWTDRPHLIDMPAQKRKALRAKSVEYQQGWRDGTNEVD